jgi:phenylpropionate dioxygenase-like ring-hydroxylating dioxygenase large terminal subunit
LQWSFSQREYFNRHSSHRASPLGSGFLRGGFSVAFHAWSFGLVF